MTSATINTVRPIFDRFMAQVRDEREKQPERFRGCFEWRWERDVENNLYHLTEQERRDLLAAVYAPLPNENPTVELVDDLPIHIIATCPMPFSA